MTGFGRAQGVLAGRQISCEIRAVNSRNLDTKIRLPGSFQVLEGKLSDQVRSRLHRGRIDMTLDEQVIAGEGKPLSIDTGLAEHYLREFVDLANSLHLKVDPDKLFGLVVGQRDVVKLPRFEVSEAVAAQVTEIVARALDDLDRVRTVEGEHLAADLRQRLETIASHLGAIREAKPETVQGLRERIQKRLDELRMDLKLDEARLVQEIVYWTDRADITEEIVRLESHLARARGLLDGKEPCGRKLDFLIQEMYREFNTIGSKAQNTSVAHLVVEMKSEIERIREQVQNLE